MSFTQILQDLVPNQAPEQHDRILGGTVDNANAYILELQGELNDQADAHARELDKNQRLRRRFARQYRRYRAVLGRLQRVVRWQRAAEDRFRRMEAWLDSQDAANLPAPAPAPTPEVAALTFHVPPQQLPPTSPPPLQLPPPVLTSPPTPQLPAPAPPSPALPEVPPPAPTPPPNPYVPLPILQLASTGALATLPQIPRSTPMRRQRGFNGDANRRRWRRHGGG